MNTITAILIDDESSARDVLENLLLRFCPMVKLLAKFENLEKGSEGIKTLKPDLVFLDIEMPNYAGYEIVDFFDTIDFDIIFVTAYDKYAIRAFEVSAVDYLLKPIDIDRLKIAVEKAVDLKEIKNSAQRFELLSKTLESNELTSIMISEKSYQYAVELSDIIALEAQESYCFVYTKEKKYTVSKNLKHFETLLSSNSNFFRTHKSWIVNLDCMENYSKSLLEINLNSGLVAKLSKYKKVEFEEFILTK